MVQLLARLWRSKPAAEVQPQGDEPAAMVAMAGSCTRAGCQNTSVFRCGYVDDRRRGCTTWCAEHLQTVNGHRLCLRHANTEHHLSQRAGTIYEVKERARVGDRSPQLISGLVEELDAEVTARLKQRYGRLPGVQIVTDPAIRAARLPVGELRDDLSGPVLRLNGSEPAWARGWGAVNHQGYLSRVSLLANGADPPMVFVKVSNAVTLAAVPDWIADRTIDGPQARAAFRHRLLDAIEEGLTPIDY